MVKVRDCFPELKDLTEARERRYRAHPERPAPEGPQSFELVEARKSGPKFGVGWVKSPDVP